MECGYTNLNTLFGVAMMSKSINDKQSNGPREHLTGTGHNIQLAVAV